MKKIVILSNTAMVNYSLIAAAQTLFPECEIEIRLVSPTEESFDPYRVDRFLKTDLNDDTWQQLGQKY